MTSLEATDLSAVSKRHPDVFRSRPWKRYGPLMLILAVIGYSFYCWWFFSIGDALRKANTDIAGAYLADWISWEARPVIDIESDGAMTITFPRFSPLGSDPRPDWLEADREMRTRTITRDAPAVETKALNDKISNSFMVPDAKGTKPENGGATSFMAPGAPTGGNAAGETATVTETVREEVVSRAVVTFDSADRVEILPDQATVTRGDETLVIRLGPGENVSVDGPLPEWAEQKYEGRKVIARFGFAGRAEIDHDGVKVYKRFLGWENFVFDTNSAFWGKSFGEVMSMIVSGERVNPARSNLGQAWYDILYNAEWQHLDVWTKLLQTIIMAFVGTLFATVVAFPLAFIAARNITPNRLVNQLAKRFFDFQRSVDMLIWALFFTRAFGPGPLAGILAIFFTDTGTLGKLYSEALENIDDKQREGVRSVGAAPLLVQRFGVMPQVLPVFLSQSLYFWESNTRSATIIGAVGAGGIGLKLWEAMRTNQDWENVAYMVILILGVVYAFDGISNFLRSRLIGESAR
ncbi:phosphonate ABC transporter, permease protein PhnE [Zhengella mangrovi]|uniref:Phosphonate ABC transporter, permease protein PhnE n=1 Tax=Zhengella mangrovi TaxID=1982044 RepID=A0A2G1QTF3_9HYPH|nr:phosphonate ABC transporter, permease protein PhnE [Zhengella mangrovi]PHP68772.1 phosphonate ABC transporter, permease protein PhnE [Zhengella mangrovi]